MQNQQNQWTTTEIFLNHLVAVYSSELGYVVKVIHFGTEWTSQPLASEAEALEAGRNDVRQYAQSILTDGKIDLEDRTVLLSGLMGLDC